MKEASEKKREYEKKEQEEAAKGKSGGYLTLEKANRGGKKQCGKEIFGGNVLERREQENMRKK